jgi:antitoxin (DNA-binding transcriptional repressor) of toxin-antitoxin stability system
MITERGRPVAKLVPADLSTTLAEDRDNRH